MFFPLNYLFDFKENLYLPKEQGRVNRFDRYTNRHSRNGLYRNYSNNNNPHNFTNSNNFVFKEKIKRKIL